MKKVLLSIAVIASIFFVNVKAIELPEVTNHEKVTIYIFRGHTCSHCYDALVYFYGNLNKYSDYIDLKAYEVWYNSTNKELMNAVAEKIGANPGGVPFFVIGDSYSSAGFGSSTGTELIETALKEYQNSKYVDVVAKVAKDNKIDAVGETLDEAVEQEGITSSSVTETSKKKEKGKYDTVIIVGILVVLIGGTAALILSNRKNS